MKKSGVCECGSGCREVQHWETCWLARCRLVVWIVRWEWCDNSSLQAKRAFPAHAMQADDEVWRAWGVGFLELATDEGYCGVRRAEVMCSRARPVENAGCKASPGRRDGVRRRRQTRPRRRGGIRSRSRVRRAHQLHSVRLDCRIGGEGSSGVRTSTCCCICECRRAWGVKMRRPRCWHCMDR